MTIKLEAGKYYKMRNGEKVYIQTLHIDKDRCRKKFVSSCGHKVFAENGDNLDWDEAMAMKQTIISEWSEPERIKGWVVIDEERNTFLVHDRLAKDSLLTSRKYIACQAIDIPVGHGITEE